MLLLFQEKCRKALKDDKYGIKIVLPHWYTYFECY